MNVDLYHHTVPTPMKDAAFNQKLFFQPYTKVPFAKFRLSFIIHDFIKSSKNIPIFGNLLGVAQFLKVAKSTDFLKSDNLSETNY